MLKQILPRLIDYLILHSGSKSQKELATRAGIDQNRMSRYHRAKEVPQGKWSDLAAGAGLSLESLSWLIGCLLQEHFEKHRFPRVDQADEVREAEARYGKPSLSERVQVVMEADLRGIEPRFLVALNNLRHRLRDLVVQIETTGTTQLEGLVAAFEELYREAASASQRPPIS